MDSRKVQKREFELSLRDWEILIRLGVYPTERQQPQKVLVSVQWKPLHPPQARQEAYWDYGKFYDQVLTRVSDREFLWIEELAEELAEEVESWLRPTAGVWQISVVKTVLPLDVGCGSAAVTLSGVIS